MDNLKLNNLSIIRANSSRSNISYRVKTYDSNNRKAQLLEIQSLLFNYKVKLNESEKILIFCPTISIVRELSEFLNIPSYYNGLKEDVKEIILNKYLYNNDPFNNILISTSGLEEGLDYPYIKVVLYIDFAFSFIGFLQGSSRGGRGINKSISLFLYKSNPFNKDEEDSSLDKTYLNKYLNEQVCLRRPINLFLNNIIHDKCEVNKEEPCSLCYMRNNIMNNTISLLKEDIINIEKNRVILKEFIYNFHNKCIICYKKGLNLKEYSHNVKNCPFLLSNNKIKWIYEVIRQNINNKKSFLLINDSCCFNCFLPTLICSNIKVKDKKGDYTCFDKDFVIFIILGFCYFQDDFHTLKLFNINSFNGNIPLLPLFFKKKYSKNLDTEIINGLNIFLELVIHIYKESS